MRTNNQISAFIGLAGILTLGAEGCPLQVLIPTSADNPALSDEFGSSSDSLSNWLQRHVLEGDATPYSLFNINSAIAGKVALRPNNTTAWYNAGRSSLFYKKITGNFSVVTHVNAHGLASTSTTPTGGKYNVGGIMARNPSYSPENWVGIEAGYLFSTVGVATKNTNSSVSTVTDYTLGLFSGKLLICRIGANYYLYYMMDGESGWTQREVFTRPDMPDEVQVGLYANSYLNPNDIQADFDYMRFKLPNSSSECTSGF